MRIFNLSAIPFVLCSLMAADPGAPAGGGAADPTALPDAEPKPEGDTLENKLTSATTWLGKLYNIAKELKSRLSTLTNERNSLEQQFNAATETANTAKSELTTVKSELSAAKTTITGLTAERDTANKSVERLETLCHLRGIDPKSAVAPQTTPAGGPGTELTVDDFNALIAAAKTPAEQEQVLKDFDKAVSEGKVKRPTT